MVHLFKNIQKNFKHILALLSLVFLGVVFLSYQERILNNAKFIASNRLDILVNNNLVALGTDPECVGYNETCDCPGKSCEPESPTEAPYPPGPDDDDDDDSGSRCDVIPKDLYPSGQLAPGTYGFTWTGYKLSNQSQLNDFTNGALRIDDLANGWTTYDCPSPYASDVCGNYNKPYNFTVQAGHTYHWWVCKPGLCYPECTGEATVIGINPTPTPTPKTLSCERIERPVSSPAPGDTITYSCTGQGNGLTNLGFRTIVNDGTPNPLPTQSAESGVAVLFPFVVPADATNVVAECRACGGGQCTDWGRSDQVISLPLLTPLPTPLPSLVINGSFENGTTGWAFWSEGSQGYQGIVVNGGYESDHAYQITTGTDQPSGWGRAACVGQNYNRNASFNNPANFAGKTLKLSGYIKTSASSTGAYLKLSITTPSGGRNPSWAGGGTNTINLQSWQYVEKVIDIPADVTKIEVDGCSGGAAGGQAWFDKAELVLNDKPPPP